MSDKKADTDRIRISQVVAGALAAVTAALVGSTMGVAGTVVGAGLASVISTVGGAVYLKSIQRTKESVRTVRAKVVGRSGGTTVLVSDEDPEEPTGAEVEAVPAEAPEEAERSDQPPRDRRRRWPALVVTTVAAFALGMLAITGVEWLRGESLSGDSGTTFGSIVAPRHGGGDEHPSTPTTSTTTPTPTTTTPDPTATTAPTTPTTPTTTSTTPPTSDSSNPTATTTPPVTTTTEATPPEGSAPASG
jgi:hypothetical protein